MDIQLRGVLVDNDEADIWRWLGWRDITCPSDISDALATAPPGEEINVLVNSPGGDMTVGAEIYSLFRRNKNCIALVQGYGASAATMAMMGCKKRTAEPGALLCYHNPSTTADGDWRALLGASNGIKNAKEAILDLYMARGGTDRQEISDLMDEDMWIAPSQALGYGLLDEVIAYDGEEEPQAIKFVAAATALPRIKAKMRADYKTHIEAEREKTQLRKTRLSAELALLEIM